MDLVDQILAYIANLIGSLTQQVAGYASNLLSTIGGWFSSLVSSVLTGIQGVFQNLAPIITGIVDGILGSLGALFSPIIDGIRTLVESTASYLGEIFRAVRDGFVSLWQEIKDVTFAVYDSIRGFVEEITAQIKAIASSVVDTVVSFVQQAIRSVADFVRSIIGGVQSIISSAAAGVRSFVESIHGFIARVIAELIALVNAGWSKLVTGAGSLVESIEKRLSDLNTAFKESTKALGETLEGALTGTFEPFTKAVSGYLELFAGLVSPEDTRRIEAAVAQALSPQTLALESRAGAFTLFQKMLPSSPLGKTLYWMILSPLLLYGVYGGVVRANSEVILQEFSAQYAHVLLPAAEVVEAWRRGVYDQQGATQILKRHGFSDSHIGTMLKIAHAPLPPGEALSLWLRGLLSGESVDVNLRASGYDGESIAALKAGSQIIPPVQDLITMAVREAFSPEIAQRFGQFDDFPAAFAEWARKQGLSDEWSKRYWAAHWSLPSASQGFEMLHRELISEADLDLLLRSLDVMPFWRERLTEIAFHNFTRVDIRRMHQIGVLSDEQVFKAHKDLGYDASNARVLTEFVVKLNKGGPADDDGDLGRLTRSAILGFYGDGLLPRERARALLVSLGSTAEASELYLSSVDLSDRRSERKAEADHIIELAQAGALDFQQAQDRLMQLGLETLEVERALTRLIRATEKTTKLPTRAEGLKMLQAAVITEGDYAELLSRLGYAPRWVNAFLQLWRKESAAADA